MLQPRRNYYRPSREEAQWLVRYARDLGIRSVGNFGRTIAKVAEWSNPIYDIYQLASQSYKETRELDHWNPKKKQKTDDPKTDDDKTDTEDIETQEKKRGPPPKDNGPMTKGLVSHSGQHCCVDLGTLTAVKGAKAPSRIPRSATLPSRHYVSTRAQVFQTAVQSSYWDVLFPAINLTNPPVVGSIPQPFGYQFNAAGVNELLRVTPLLDNVPAIPTYLGTGQGVSDPNGAKGGLLLSDQFLELKIKNITSQDSVGMASDSPVYFSIYCLQLKEDIHFRWDQDTLYNDAPLRAEFLEGFAEKYDFEAAKFINQPTRSVSQRYGVNIMDNEFVLKKCNILDVQKHCLSVGQEGTMRAYIPQKQWNNYQYLLNAKSYGATATTYLPVMHRAGEIFFVIGLHGGIQAGQVAAGPVTTIDTMEVEAVRLGVHALFKFTFNEVDLGSGGEKARYDREAPAQALEDVDIQEHFAK